MADYRIQETGAVVTEHEFRGLHPTTSFPSVITEEMANDFGADVVFEGPQPTATKYQVVYRDGVEEIDGQRFTKYAVADMEQEAIDALTEQQWDRIRRDRNKRLADCDWTQLSDAPLSNTKTAEWGLYRQSLRDITTQSDPFNIFWPEQP